MLIHTEHSIEIEVEIDRVFEITNNLERWPELLPPCRDLKIIDRQGNRTTFEITVFVNDRLMTWRSSRMVDEKSKKTKSQREHPMGPFKSMTIQWLFETVPEGTRLTFVHDFEMRWHFIGYLLGKFYVAPVYISKTSLLELQAIKAKLEDGKTSRWG